tara:strand:+ start:1866 stop:2120 length:255 start_codon:yes stop_codon:yes gene_type:complete
MRNTPLKAFASPVKHTTNRKGHKDTYGKGHDNSAHPDYWKKHKGVSGKKTFYPDPGTNKEADVGYEKFNQKHDITSISKGLKRR